MKHLALILGLLTLVAVICLYLEVADLRGHIVYKNIVLDQWRAKWHQVAVDYVNCRVQATDWRLQFFACQKAYTELRETCR